jgi:hypothetical protein
MKKMLLSLLVLGSLSNVVHAAEMLGNAPAVAYTHCGGLKVLSTAISSENVMILQLTDAKTNVSQLYVGKRTADESDKVKYVLSTYNPDNQTFTPDAANTTIRFGIKMGPTGSKGSDQYSLTMAGQNTICAPFTVYDPLAGK